MIYKLSRFARDLLPSRFQVPSKYWYGWLRGSLEAEMKFIELIVRRGDTVVDVGGNRGIYAYRIWKMGATVEVFEPNPICCQVLKAWAAGRRGVSIHPIALSSRAGAANLHIPIDGSGVEHDASASIEHSAFALTREQVVELKTLDSYNFSDISMIKIDVEGHEFDVIEGAAGTIAALKPALLVEIEQRHIDRPIGDVFAKILRFGYEGTFLGEMGLVKLENFDVSRDQSMKNFGSSGGRYVNNFLFLHRSRIDGGEYSAIKSCQISK